MGCSVFEKRVHVHFHSILMRTPVCGWMLEICISTRVFMLVSVHMFVVDNDSVCLNLDRLRQRHPEEMLFREYGWGQLITCSSLGYPISDTVAKTVGPKQEN